MRASDTEWDVQVLRSISFDRQTSPTPTRKVPEPTVPLFASPHHLGTCYQWFLSLKQGMTRVGPLTYEEHHRPITFQFLETMPLIRQPKCIPSPFDSFHFSIARNTVAKNTGLGVKPTLV